MLSACGDAHEAARGRSSRREAGQSESAHAHTPSRTTGTVSPWKLGRASQTPGQPRGTALPPGSGGPSREPSELQPLQGALVLTEERKPHSHQASHALTKTSSQIRAEGIGEPHWREPPPLGPRSLFSCYSCYANPGTSDILGWINLGWGAVLCPVAAVLPFMHEMPVADSPLSPSVTKMSPDTARCPPSTPG